MDILKVKTGNVWTDIPALVGPKGERGSKGDTGLKGDSGNDPNAVHFNASQSLTELQKSIARNNIGAVNVNDYNPVAKTNTMTKQVGKDSNGRLWTEPDIVVESLTVDQNGTYTAPGGKAYSPITVNVPQGGGGSSGVYVGRTDPEAELGENGDYYYRRSDLIKAIDFTPSWESQSALTGGIKFTTSKSFRIGGLSIYGRPGSTYGNVYLSTLDGTELASITNIPTTSDKWNDGILPEPIVLPAGQYVVWGSLNSTAMMYEQYTDILPLNGITFNCALYSQQRDTFPSVSENSARYSIDVIVLLDDKIVQAQYRKKSGAWVRIDQLR